MTQLVKLVHLAMSSSGAVLRGTLVSETIQLIKGFNPLLTLPQSSSYPPPSQMSRFAATVSEMVDIDFMDKAAARLEISQQFL